MLIAVCGIDGAGKSTQINYLKDYFDEKGIDVYLTKQPTADYRKYDRFRAYVNKLIAIDDEFILKELALYAASDKLRHCQSEIFLNQDKIIICDRHIFSFYAYFLSRGIKDIDWLKRLNKFLPMPDITFYLDVDPEVALHRIFLRDGESKKKEEQDLDLMRKVRKCFLQQPWGRQENYYIINNFEEPVKATKEIFQILNLIMKDTI